MSFEEYQSVEHPEPYIYILESDSGALLYFGSRHSFNPEDPQMEQLEKAWKTFKPEVAYAEGGELEIDSLNRKELIGRYGEFGLAWMLARQDGISVRSLDPSRESEVKYLRDEGWSGEQLMLFYTLRQVAQSQQQQISVDFSEVVPKYLNSLVQRFGLEGPTTIDDFEDAVARLLPDVHDWKTIAMTYFYPGPQNPSHFTNEIATESNIFRDQYHADLLKKAVLSGKRVFAIAGSAHAVMQEPALRTALNHQN